MNIVTADELHRLVKLAMDTGEAESIEHAQRIFAGYRIGVAVGPEIRWSWSHQAALLTFLELANRVFLGGVQVAIPADDPIPNLISESLSVTRTMDKLGARRVQSLDPHIATVLIGATVVPSDASFVIRLVFNGWRAGIIPAGVTPPFEFSVEFPLSAIMAAALAVNEAFLFVRGDTPEAGLREIGISLWEPDVIDDWSAACHDGPRIDYLPNKLWLIGLGHLGQAYLWALSLFPYERPEEVSLVLQDIDVITKSTLSTSILSDQNMIGLKKTRAMSGVMEARGFKTAIIERRFDETLRIQPDDPQIALCGLDNALGRQPLCEVGFKFVVEAGLGSGAKDFRAIRIHTFPGTRDPRDLWRSEEGVDLILGARAYDDFKARGLDQCGVTMLAGKAVGAPFVGVTAAAISMAEILRILHDGQVFALHDMNLKSPCARVSLKRNAPVGLTNPGFSSSLRIAC
ncbi:MAG: hypothetical protein ACYDBH_03660 [Acidobacteriaceae bacterium]